MADVCSKEPSGLLFKVDFAIYFLAIQLNKRLLLIKKNVFFWRLLRKKKNAPHQGGEASELSANLNEKKINWSHLFGVSNIAHHQDRGLPSPRQIAGFYSAFSAPKGALSKKKRPL